MLIKKTSSRGNHIKQGQLKVHALIHLPLISRNGQRGKTIIHLIKGIHPEIKKEIT